MSSPSLRAGCEPRCRGCKHKYLSAVESEQQKVGWLQSQLGAYVQQLEPLKAVKGEARWAYRNKTSLHAHWNRISWEFGLLDKIPGTLYDYEVVPIHECPIHTAFIGSVLKELAQLLPPFDVFPLVHLAISGTILTLVLKTPEMPVLPALSCIDWGGLGLSGVYLNLNPSAGNRIFANKAWHLFWGAPYARDLHSHWIYGPESFQQLIAELHEESVEEVKRFFTSQGLNAVMDLYSGSGRTQQIWRSLGMCTIGVELNGDSYRCAEMNLGEKISLRGKVSERRPQLEEWLHGRVDPKLGVYLNPPRTGLESDVAEWIATRVQPQVIAYLSCSAGTLARDLRILTSLGYSVIKIQPYDFFPQTHHVEVLTLLVRQTA